MPNDFLRIMTTVIKHAIKECIGYLIQLVQLLYLYNMQDIW